MAPFGFSGVTERDSARTSRLRLPRWAARRIPAACAGPMPPSFDREARVASTAAQFRVATGYRPREYLLHERVERAKSLLSGSDTPLAEVALAVGFCTQAHFSTVFKRMTGDTPARWRSAMRNASASSGDADGDPRVETQGLSRVLGADLS